MGMEKPAVTPTRPLGLAAVLWIYLALACPAIAAEFVPDCALRPMSQLDLQTTADGRVTIPVKFEGHDHRFLVDTGGYINTVARSLALAEKYSIKAAPSTEVGMGASRLDKFVTADDFLIGHSHGRHFEFFVDDNNALEWDGTLAPQILAAYDVEFDFAHEKFNLFSPDHCPGRVVYWTKDLPAIVPMEISRDMHIRVPVRIGGKEIMATLDTGSDSSFLSMRGAWRYLDIDEKNSVLKSLGNMTINGMAGQTMSYPFESLSFGDADTGSVTVNHPRIIIVPNKIWDQTDLLLGASVLRQLHIYIAYKEKKLYITPALAEKAAN